MKLRIVLAVLVFAGFAACTNAPTTPVDAEFRPALETKPDSFATMEIVAEDSTTTTERGGGALGGGS